METKSSFTTQICNRLGNWWTVCKFNKKIAVSLSGLCDAAPIDQIFSLAEPAKDSSDRYGTFIGMTGWIIEFDKGDKIWKIHHKIFTKNTLKLLDSNRRPFGKKLWEVGEYVCEGVAPLGLRWLALGRRAGAHRALGLLGRGL